MTVHHVFEIKVSNEFFNLIIYLYSDMNKNNIIRYWLELFCFWWMAGWIPFFNGEIYDAYSLLIDIINGASKEIIIIDNYVDKVTLDILTKKKVNVTILLITDKNKSKITKTDIDKFNSEYKGLTIKYTNIFHDRFIIIDEDILYHSGSSFKDLGKKCFCLSIIEDKNYLSEILKKAKVWIQN